MWVVEWPSAGQPQDREAQAMCRSDLATPAEPNSGTKETTQERSVTHTAFAELLQPMVLFVTTDKDLSGKEGEIQQYGFKTLTEGKSNTINVNELTAPAPKPT